MPTEIEWPRGSGRKALYEPHEILIVQRLMERCGRGEIDQAQLALELGHLHDLKVELDAHVVEPTNGSRLPDPARPMMGQYHHDGQQTEREAAARAIPRAGTARRRVLDFLRQQGPEGATDYELNEMLLPGRRSVSAGTRRGELIRDGWPIRDSGRKRGTDTATPAIVWVLDADEDVEL